MARGGQEPCVLHGLTWSLHPSHLEVGHLGLLISSLQWPGPTGRGLAG